MILSGLLCALVGLPSAAGFDTAKYLSSDRLARLPLDVVGPAGAIKQLLDASPKLHFDQPQEWGRPELLLFNYEYLPRLKDFVAVVAQHPDLVQSSQRSYTSGCLDLQELGQTLLHLMIIKSDTDAVNSVDLSATVTLLPKAEMLLWTIEGKFRALREFVSHLILERYCRNAPCTISPRGLLESGTFGLVVKVCYLNGPIYALIESPWAEHEMETAQRALEIMDEGDYLFLQGELQESVEKLPSVFSELQQKVDELIEAGCDLSWISDSQIPWLHLITLRKFDYSWAPWSGNDQQNPIIRLRTVALLRSRICAILAGETLILKLKAAKPVPSLIYYGEASRESAFQSRIQKLLSAGVDREESFLVEVESFVAHQRDVTGEILVSNLRQWQPVRLRDACLGFGAICEALESVQGLRFQNDEVIQDGSVKTVGLLKDSYSIIKRLVEYYAQIFELGAKKLAEPWQKGRLLQSLFQWHPIIKALLLSKSFMCYAEELLERRGQLVERYGWDSQFPVSRLLYPSLSAKRAQQEQAAPPEHADGVSFGAKAPQGDSPDGMVDD